MPGIVLDARIDLTDSEWMSLIDGTRDGGLQKCCANISNLRDAIIQIARDGGRYHASSIDFLRAYRACADGHDGLGRIPALVKLRDACLAHSGITLEQLLEKPHADRRYMEW
jgi:hypothetical protein